MGKPAKRDHGIHYALVSKDSKSCPSCGGEKGWHKHAHCDGLRARWATCVVTHVDKERGTRRCRLPLGWDVAHRVSWKGARLHFHQYTGDGLYCEHHARELASHLNTPLEQDHVA